MSRKKYKKLSQKDRQALWGVDIPYSEVGVIEQHRILNDGVSRIFLVTEAKINPFTFEYIFKNRDAFANDMKMQDLLDHAEYRGLSDGYVVSAGEEELIDMRSIELTKQYKQMLIDQILKMHNFVSEAFGLQGIKLKDSKENTIKDSVPSSEPSTYVWNDIKGVTSINNSIQDSDTIINSSAGIKNGKFRYFTVLALGSTKKTLTKEEVRFIMSNLMDISKKLKVDIEDVNGNSGYIIITALISTDTLPADFIETFIKNANSFKKENIFLLDYFITNVARPSFCEIEGFLRKIKKKS